MQRFRRGRVVSAVQTLDQIKERSSRSWIAAALGGLALVADAVASVPAPGLHWPDRLVPLTNVHVTQHVLSPSAACPGPLCRNDPVNNFDPLGLMSVGFGVFVSPDGNTNFRPLSLNQAGELNATLRDAIGGYVSRIQSGGDGLHKALAGVTAFAGAAVIKATEILVGLGTDHVTPFFERPSLATCPMIACGWQAGMAIDAAIADPSLESVCDSVEAGGQAALVLGGLGKAWQLSRQSHVPACPAGVAPEAPLVQTEGAPRATVTIGPDFSSAAGTRVWRHVPQRHPALADARAGVIRPYGLRTEAPLDIRALAHDTGLTRGSGLTSWTADQGWALSRQLRTGGVVVETVAPEGSIWLNQAAKCVESQVLIPGTVRLK